MVSPMIGNLHLLSIFITLISLASMAATQSLVLEAASYDTPLFRRLEKKGQILFDRRDPPPIPRAIIERRHDNGDSSSSTSTLSVSSASSTATSTGAASTTANANASASSSSHFPSTTFSISLKPTATDITASGTAVPSALPSPFDSSVGSNFTSEACPNFFNSFLSNTTFLSCVPVSLLLQNSKSFFNAARSPVVLTETLNAACAVSLPLCQPLMASLAAELISDTHCGADYRNQNPIVARARAGLVAYEPVYQATCLKSNDTGNYCFVDAITNQLNPSDGFPYYTAVGLSLPPASHTTCSRCLQNTMSIFAVYARDKNQPLAATYLSTAQEINGDCSANFANTNVSVGTASSTSGCDVRKNPVLNLVAAIVVVAVAFSLA